MSDTYLRGALVFFLGGSIGWVYIKSNGLLMLSYRLLNQNGHGFSKHHYVHLGVFVDMLWKLFSLQMQY